MPGWAQRAVSRTRRLARDNRVAFTAKAEAELAAMWLRRIDVIEVLSTLSSQDLYERRVSDRTGEWLYVFKPEVGHGITYLKVVLRNDCVVVSLHEDHDGEVDQGA